MGFIWKRHFKIRLGITSAKSKQEISAKSWFIAFLKNTATLFITRAQTDHTPPPTEKVICEPVNITPPAQVVNLFSEIVSRAKQFKGYGLNGKSLITAIKFVADEKKFDPTPYLEFAKMAKDESFDEPAQARSADEQSFFYGQSDARP